MATDVVAKVTLGGLPTTVDVQLDGEPAGPTVTVRPGRFPITLTAGVAVDG
ncbi:hypothetical protein [Mycobacterium sp. 1165178.9]|uniref:hypothetical protein n=1 Tax=Mycobacterium sp. 1165178.9 TaxID=1834070 RepID=UPI000B1BE7B0|nr:hypothetical protein [Mycobacterium sp. 1165178.9]